MDSIFLADPRVPVCLLDPIGGIASREVLTLKGTRTDTPGMASVGSSIDVRWEPWFHEEIVMEHLNVEGLPKPIVRGLEILVEMARTLAGKRIPPTRRERVQLGVRKGTVYGKLTREEIYDDIA